MEIKKYKHYFESKSNELIDVIEELTRMINDTIKDSNESLDAFIAAYKSNPNDKEIYGLINESDIYEFYIKYRIEIDKVLLDIKFYDEKPSEFNCFSLYDYTIKGTKRAIKDLVEKI